MQNYNHALEQSRRKVSAYPQGVGRKYSTSY